VNCCRAHKVTYNSALCAILGKTFDNIVKLPDGLMGMVLYVCLHICNECMHVYVYVSMCVYMRMYMCVYVYVCVCVLIGF